MGICEYRAAKVSIWIAKPTTMVRNRIGDHISVPTHYCSYYDYVRNSAACLCLFALVLASLRNKTSSPGNHLYVIVMSLSKMRKQHLAQITA